MALIEETTSQTHKSLHLLQSSTLRSRWTSTKITLLHNQLLISLRHNCSLSRRFTVFESGIDNHSWLSDCQCSVDDLILEENCCLTLDGVDAKPVCEWCFVVDTASYSIGNRVRCAHCHQKAPKTKWRQILHSLNSFCKQSRLSFEHKLITYFTIVYKNQFLWH